MVSNPEPDPRLTRAPADPGAAGGAAAAPETTLTFQAIKRDTLPAPAGGLSAAHQAAVDALPAGSALLVVQQGPTAGARFLLATDRITAGRHPSSDIFLDDVTVSRKHAEFLRRDGGYVLRDVGGLNGTYIGRDRIDEAFLRNGDEVRVGKFRMVFYASPRSSPADLGS